MAMAGAMAVLVVGLGATPAMAAPQADEAKSAQVQRGKSPSDPDAERNGGTDKPDGTTGNNDRDGNNGSGNDTDCEDDNNGRGTPGHCTDRPAEPAVGPEKQQTPRARARVKPATTPDGGEPGTSAPEPDAERNGGTDKPDGTTGNNDREATNGSGNDTDCEDDNNGRGTPGHCTDEPAKPSEDDESNVGGKPGEDMREPEGTDEEHPTYVVDPPWPDAPRGKPQVLGVEQAVEQAVEQTVGQGVGQTDDMDIERVGVLGVSAERGGVMAAATGVLPNTGAGAALLAMVVLGGISAAAGLLLIRIRRATA